MTQTKKIVPIITNKNLGLMSIYIILSFIFLNACEPNTGGGDDGGDDGGTSHIENPVIYQIKSNTIGDSTLYVFGSIHQGYEGAPYGFADEFMEKYNASTNIVFEADVTLPSFTLAIAYTQELNKNLLLNKGDARGSELSGYIGTVNWQRLLKIFSNESVSDFKTDLAKKSVAVYSTRIIDDAYTQSLMSLPVPTVLFSSNSAAASTVSATYGVDITLLNLAKAEGKTLEFLETPNEQYATQFAVGLDEQVNVLNAYIDKYYRIGLDSCYVKGFSIESYIEQDMTVFNALAASHKICMPSYYAEVLVGRNDSWITKMRAFMPNNKTYFIVVGILHLSGEDSIISKMQASDDFTVTKL